MIFKKKINVQGIEKNQYVNIYATKKIYICNAIPI